jgi:hypothetical protein
MVLATLSGPYRLEIDEIRDVLPAGWPGVYALGYLDQDDAFCITYVDCSYDDLAQELIAKVGTSTLFKAHRCHSAEDAFQKVCELYHTFRPFGNFLHPDRPKGVKWACPICVPVPLRSGAHSR